MLILAGVSISAIVGEDGILSRASKATETHKKASILEELNMQLAGYNVNTITDKDAGIKQIMSELLTNGYIDSVLNSGGNYVQDVNLILPVPRFDENNNYMGEFAYGVKKDGYGINIYTANDGIYMAEYGEIVFSSGGNVQAGTVLVTQDSFNNSDDVSEEDKGKYEIKENTNIIFIDKVEGELAFHIQEGAHAKINIFRDMNLTNAGVKRSAIDIEPGGILDLYIADGATLTVDSGLGESGTIGGAGGSAGGPGGYAGIHVPKDKTGKEAEVNLMGNGTLIAYGGDAGDGEFLGTGAAGASGGGGAGAGIGGNGGTGGGGSLGHQR